MKVTTTHSAMKVTREFTITGDGPVVPMAYNRQGKQVRVLRGAIEYTWTPEGWIVINEYAVNLLCIVLKKDGSESVNSHNRRPEATSNWTATQLEVDEEYAWLQPIIDLLRPTGEPSMMSLKGTEVTS